MNDDDFDDDFDELDEDDPADDCMLMDDGQCMAAGSEWCDFECPYRDSERFAGSKAWQEKQAADAVTKGERDCIEDSPPKVIRPGAEVIHVREIRPATPKQPATEEP